jgi:glycosyltransferase involved in cell wall biosynthesis
LSRGITTQWKILKTKGKILFNSVNFAFKSMVMQDQPKIKVVHLSSAHPDLDVRIFHKECCSLAANNVFDVHLVLAGVEERVDQNVTIHSVPKIQDSRLKRMWSTVNDVYKKAVELDADVYHLHDPELLRIAGKLKRRGKKVIYDAHEDLPRQLLGKSYLKFKGLISAGFERYENGVVKKLDGVITATPFIRDRFLKINPNTLDVNNYPLLREIDMIEDGDLKQNKVCFIGGISKIRGITEVVKAMSLCDVELDLAGAISADFKRELEQLEGWEKVNELGYIDRKTALQVKKECFAGLVTFLPLPNHINAQPNKIFEYMASGIPVIGSDFPLWRQIIRDNKCGICVDPNKPEEIAKAIMYLKDHPSEAKEMGAKGRKLVSETYNWSAEEKKLVEFYNGLMIK